MWSTGNDRRSAVAGTWPRRCRRLLLCQKQTSLFVALDDGKSAVANFFKSIAWDKIPEESTLTFRTYGWHHLVKATEVTAGLAESNGRLPPGE